MKKSVQNKNTHQVKGTSTKKKSEKKPGKETLLFLLLAFFIPLLVYIHTVKFGFTNFDDDIIISTNGAFLGDFTNLKQVFVKDAVIATATPFYRPLQTISYMVDYHISGVENPWAFHLTNIILLAGISCLLFLFLWRLMVPKKIAFLGSLLFCVHPLFTFTAAWLPARGDLLLTFFSLLSLLLLMEFLKNGKKIFLVTHWIAFTLALFSKETAAVLAFVLILYYYVFFSKNRFEKKYFLNLVLYAVSGIVWFWLRTKAIGGISVQNESFDFGIAALFKNLRIIPESLTSFFLPFDISPIPAFSLIKCYIGVGLIIACLTAVFIKLGRSGKEKVFCIAWFIMFFLPSLLLTQFLIDYLSHRFLLPYIGVLMLILFILPEKWIREKLNQTSIVFILVTAVFCLVSHNLARAYSDPTTFFDTVIENNHSSPLAYNNRALVKMSSNDYTGAIRDFDGALKIYNKFNIAYFNKGICEFNLKNFTEAEDCFNKCLAAYPKNQYAYFYRGMNNASLGKLKEAYQDFSKAVEIDPKYTDAIKKKFVARYFLRDYQGTIEDCETYLKLVPGDQTALGYKAKAQEELRKK